MNKRQRRDHSAVFRVTRNSEYEIDDDEVEDLLKTIEEEVRKRRRGFAVRLEIETDAQPELQSFLMTALDRTLPFTEIDCIAMRIADNLNFDMARADDALFDKHSVIAECRSCLVSGCYQRFLKIIQGIHSPHPFAATTSHGFAKPRITNTVRQFVGA